MPSSGSGVGTPTSGSGLGSGPETARPLPATLLSLNRYARIMGINPLHFAGATAGSTFMPLRNACSDVWWRHSWQYADHVSHEDLTRSIADAETQIAQQLGYWPAPTWIMQDEVHWPRHHRAGDVKSWPLTRARGAWNMRKSLRLSWGKVITAGRRATSVEEAGASVVYSDEDADGFSETATVTVTNVAATDVDEIKLYFAGTAADPRWEIRPLTTKTLSGTTLTATLESWSLIDPDLLAAYPTQDTHGHAVDLSSNFSTKVVATVDVYRVYTDGTTIAPAQLVWERDRICDACGGSGCQICDEVTQDACVQVRDPDEGLIATPPTSGYTDGQWALANSWEGNRPPDRVRAWYRAGARSRDWRAGYEDAVGDELSEYWAQTIAWLATARVEREFCQCSNVNSLTSRLRQDVSVTTADQSIFLPRELISNPFGTRRGEIMAWQRVMEARQQPGARARGGAVVGL